jgi:hypothetical protein
VSTILLDEKVDEKVGRSDLPDDSIILVLEEHRFKVPIDYMYSKLLEKDLTKKKYSVERRFKKAMSQLIVDLIVQCVSGFKCRGLRHEISRIQSLDKIN